jgi:hypothetical protein
MDERQESQSSIGRIALLWRGDSGAAVPAPAATRFHLIFSALDAAGLATEPILYSEEMAQSVHAHRVLVSVNPLDDGKDRSGLDLLLRDVAARGVWVSAHPDVILKMGVKEVLYHTRGLGWGTDTGLYLSIEDFDTRFPTRLGTGGPRVLKQNRGNGGQGVWKVELVSKTDTKIGPSTGPGPSRSTRHHSGRDLSGRIHEALPSLFLRVRPGTSSRIA